MGIDHLRWRAPHAGTFYLELKWTFKWAPTDPYEFHGRIIRDDFGDSPAQAEKLSLGQEQKAHLENVADRDWFSFEAEAGKFYRVTQGDADLSWPRLTVFASDGKTPVPPEDYDSLVMRAPASGTYYLKAEPRDRESLVNLYPVKVVKLSDWGTSPENAPRWDLAETLEGELAPGTVNYYRSEADSGDKYVFVSDGAKHLAILDSDGKRELGSIFIYFGSPGRLEWSAPHSGVYYLSASTFACCLFVSESGPYSVDAYKVMHDADPAKAPTIKDGQTIKGNMENPADAHYFGFQAKGGSVYRFTTNDKDDGADYLLDVIESKNDAANMPETAMQVYPGHNRGKGFDGETGLTPSMEFYAERSGTYTFGLLRWTWSIAGRLR